MTPNHRMGDGGIACEGAMRSTAADADGAPPTEAERRADAFERPRRRPREGRAISDLGRARDRIDEPLRAVSE